MKVFYFLFRPTIILLGVLWLAACSTPATTTPKDAAVLESDVGVLESETSYESFYYEDEGVYGGGRHGGGHGR